jgi:CDGSH-type Zn-finger protein
VRASGGDVYDAADVLVARRPPSLRQFVAQRVRQAYDSRAQPSRLVVELALLPAAVFAAAVWPPALLAAAAAVVVLAEVGRRRGGGRRAWPATAPLWSVAWVAERSVTAWLATAAAVRGGVRYRARRLKVAAHRIGDLDGSRCPEASCVCRLPQRARETRAAPQHVVMECPGGPVLVRGSGAVRDLAGVVHEVTRPVVALCRCDRSARLPWCDGTHKLVQRAFSPKRAAPPSGRGSRQPS